MFRISFVCTGNICRSPMGEVVFRALAARAGLGDHVEVTSSGVHGCHAGEGADPRAVRALAAAGYDGSRHRSSRLSDTELRECDLLIAMDRGHQQEMLSRGASPERVRLLTEYDPAQPNDPDVFDPYYADDAAFETVLAQVERSCVALLAELQASAAIPQP